MLAKKKAEELYKKHYVFIGNKESAIHCACITAMEVLSRNEDIAELENYYWKEVLLELNLME